MIGFEVCEGETDKPLQLMASLPSFSNPAVSNPPTVSCEKSQDTQVGCALTNDVSTNARAMVAEVMMKREEIFMVMKEINQELGYLALKGFQGLSL